MCGRRRSARTANCWPPPTTTTRCGCGTARPGGMSRRSPSTGAGCAPSPSARTAAGWRPAATTVRCGSGTSSGRLRHAVLDGHADRVYSVVFSPDGACWPARATTARRGIWDDGRGVPVHTLSGTGDGSGRPRSARTARCSPPRAMTWPVRLWDVRTGEHLHALTGHSRRVWSVAFSPDGTLLASAATTARSGCGIPAAASRRGCGCPARPPGGWAALASDGVISKRAISRGSSGTLSACAGSSGELDATSLRSAAAPGGAAAVRTPATGARPNLPEKCYPRAVRVVSGV